MMVFQYIQFYISHTDTNTNHVIEIFQKYAAVCYHVFVEYICPRFDFKSKTLNPRLPSDELKTNR